jgi:hypothetical protein
MSIVLVIIGLIVGGVLVGQDLIKAARVRAGITQLEKYNTAVNTFRGKYNCLPGDCQNTVEFGLSNLIGTTQAGSAFYDNGNGDGQINDAYWNYNNAYWKLGSTFSQETWNFWYSLAAAHLIAGSYSGSDGPWTASYAGNIAQASPMFDMLGPPFQVWVWYSQGSHYWSFLCSCSAISGTVNGTFPYQVFTAAQAQSIDGKIDDGSPMSGSVLATREGTITFNGSEEDPSWNNPRGSAAGSPGCVVNTVTPYAYNITYSLAYCNLTIKTSF